MIADLSAAFDNARKAIKKQKAGRPKGRPPGTSIPAEPAPWITAKIQAKYFVDDDVKARNIDVTTQSGVLTLQGTVSSEAERRQAIAMARNNSGGREVCGSGPTRSSSTMARCTVREPLVGGVAVMHPASSCLAKKYRVAGMVRTRRERVLSSLPEELMGKLVWVLAPFAAVAWFVLLAFNSVGAIVVLLAGVSWWDRRRRLGRIRPHE